MFSAHHPTASLAKARPAATRRETKTFLPPSASPSKAGVSPDNREKLKEIEHRRQNLLHQRKTILALKQQTPAASASPPIVHGVVVGSFVQLPTPVAKPKTTAFTSPAAPVIKPAPVSLPTRLFYQPYLAKPAPPAAPVKPNRVPVQASTAAAGPSFLKDAAKRFAPAAPSDPRASSTGQAPAFNISAVAQRTLVLPKSTPPAVLSKTPAPRPPTPFKTPEYRPVAPPAPGYRPATRSFAGVQTQAFTAAPAVAASRQIAPQALPLGAVKSAKKGCGCGGNKRG